MWPGRAGYTLLELIVVMALIGIVFFYAVPRFEGSFFFDEAKQSSRWLIGKLQTLREEALRTHRRHVLHVDFDTNRFWQTSEAMTAEEVDLAVRRSQRLPGGALIMSIEFPGLERIQSGRTEIRFFGDGHTDRVLIHLRQGDVLVSFLLEPFLSQVKMFDAFVTFDDVRL